jgi:hypothetical protein
VIACRIGPVLKLKIARQGQRGAESGHSAERSSVACRKKVALFPEWTADRDLN